VDWLCIPGPPWTHNRPALASQVLRPQVYATTVTLPFLSVSLEKPRWWIQDT
jgi:hypothetical protein